MAGFRKKAYKVEQKIFGKGGVKGRYGIGKGRGGFKFAKLAADLEMVKNRLNVEKKEVRSDVVTTSIGQVSANLEGAYVADLTQAINQGIGETQRIGNSLKVTGMSMPIQISHQSNAFDNKQIRMTLLRVRSADNGTTATEAFEKVWEVNPLTGVRDYNAPRAYRNSKTDGISVVRSMTCYLPQRERQGSNDSTINTKTLKFNVKLNDVWRYTENSDTLLAGLKYYLVFQMNTGNSAVTNSTLDVPIVSADSGVELRLAQRTWFVDN
jgi:hypothetical protein